MDNNKIIILGLLMILNIFNYFLVGYDKQKARKNEWRIPEKRFFILGIIGGGLGIYLGMKHFRHKTKHLQFTVGIPLIILINILMFYFIFLPDGASSSY